MPVTAIIPALNEAERIGATIDAARAAGVAEVIVADGGSSDATIRIATAYGARTIEGERIRARRLNRGAEAASHDVLVFLHADTLLPTGAAHAIEHALQHGAIFGGFRIAFLEPGLDLAARLINVRTRLTRAPWGDQAQFTTVEVFRRIGGFPEFPIMEDYELARRMKRLGHTVVLPLAVRTSGRRFLQKGVLRTAAMNWRIIVAYHLGVAPERLASWYRDPSS